jgi:hypothetical protein
MNRSNGQIEQQAAGVGRAQLARVAGSGSAHHPHFQALLGASGPHAGRDFADAVHLLCALHGHHPGVIALALELGGSGSAGEWLREAGDAFERERRFLVQLTVAVGPIPSTPGAAQSQSCLLAARHALETLAKSERAGCAIGAATALISDWSSLRRLLDRAATRAGIEAPPSSLPDEQSLLNLLDTYGVADASARALSFGCEQLLLQHRALMDLLEARAEARGDF